MAVEIEIGEEIERDVQGTKDFVFVRIGDPVPIKAGDSSFDLQDPPSQPLAVCERHRVLFLAHSDGFLAAKTKDVIGLAKEIKEKGKGPCIEQASVVDVHIGRVSILALSTDSSMLAATIGGDIRFYSVPSLLTKDVEPSFSCSLEKSCIVKDFKWRRNVNVSYIILSSHGSLYHGHLENHLKVVMGNVDAVNWSEDGNFVAVARKNSLSILSPDFQEQIHVSLTFQSWSDGNDLECSVRVDSIKWVRDDSIIVGCVRAYEDGREEDYLVRVLASRDHSFIKSSSKPVMFSFPDLFEDISDDMLPTGCGPYLLASYLERWGLIVASNKKAIGQHLLLLQWSLDDNRKEAVSFEYRDERHTPNISLQESGDDNLVLGLGVDKISLYEKVKIKAEEEVKELAPYIILLCLTSEGKLIMFHVARVSDPSDLPQTTLPPADYYGMEEKLSTVISSEDELSVTSSRLKDRTEAVVSDHKLGHISKEQSDLYSGKELKGMINSGKEGRGTAGSVPGFHAGQVSTVDSPQIQGSSIALSNNTKAGNQDLSLMFSRTSSAPFIDSMSGKASVAKQEGPKFSEQSRDVGSDIFYSTSSYGASFGTQSTRQLFTADSFNAKSSSVEFSRSYLGESEGSAAAGQRNRPLSSPHDRYSDNLLPSVEPLSLRGSSALHSSVLCVLIKPSQSVGQATFPTRGGNAQSTLHYQPVSAQRSSSGMAMHSRSQPILDNSRNNRSQMLVSEPELSTQFYNVKDMTRELDKLLSYIEQEGGFRDACTIFLETPLLALEHGLEDLSNISQLCRNQTEVQLGKLQQLKNKMLQVSTKKVHMEGIIKQAFNSQYWDRWNRQKLSPEFEMKRQRILNLYQSLTDQLIELERHFNTLEISKFGESSRVCAGRKMSRSLNPSRQIPSMQRIYSSLNSQLAAAEQLSEFLSTQMALLKIDPPSAKRSSVAKELLESIGLHHETGSFQPPDIQGHYLTPNSVKRSPSSTYSAVKENLGMNNFNALKILEPETVRRRRYSLEKSLANFEPQKTSVKRMSRKERIGVATDSAPPMVSFNSPMAGSAIIQQRSNVIPAFSSSQPSMTKFQSPAYLSGMEKKPSKEVTGSQSNSPFKWATELSGSSLTLESESHLQGVQRSSKQPLSSTMAPSPALFSYGQNTSMAPSPTLFSYGQNTSMAPSPTLFSHGQNTDGNVGLHDASSTRMTHLGSKSSSFQVESVPKFQVIPTNSDTFTTHRTSLKFSSTVLPVKATSPSQALDFISQASEQSNLKSPEDSLIWPTAASIKQSVDSSRNSFPSPNSDSLSSLSTISSLPYAERKQDAALVDEIKSINHSPLSLKASYVTTPGSTASPTLGHAPSKFSNLGLTSSPIIFEGSSPMKAPDGESQRLASVAPSASSTSVASPSHKSLVSPMSRSPSQNAALSSASSQVIVPVSRSEPSSLTQKNVMDTQHLGDVSPKSEPVISQAPKSGELVGFSSQSTLISSMSSGMVPNGSSSSEVPSVALTPLSASITEKDDGLETSSEEDEMEEEAPDAGNAFSLGSLGGFGLGSAPPSSSPKLNPFGGSFVTPTAISSSPLAASPGELFRPASFSVPSAQQVRPVQPQSSGSPSSGFGGGFSGFGQPSQIGAGQQALGSVLGTFGQSRQLGSGAQGFGFASGGFGGSGLSVAASSGGFAGAAGGGFAAISSAGGGFSGAATGGGFGAVASSGGGFAGAATGGGFGAVAPTGGGFAAAATGGGFVALASKGGGFAAAASGGVGFGGSNPGGGFTAGGGFGAFSNNQGGGGFSAFGGNSAAVAGRPPAELLTQMRK